jgi:hypothetical protein
MRLQRVDIRNYRSIADVAIHFEPRCRVLVGINEAGKTNILRALSLLDPSVPILRSDIRETRPGEPYDQDAYVRFVFVLDGLDRAQAFSALKPSILLLDPDTELVVVGNKALSLPQFLEQRTEVLYRVNLKTGQRYFTTWSLSAQHKLNPKWKKPSPSCPPTFTVSSSAGSSAPVSTFALVYAPDFPDIPAEYLADANFEELVTLVDGASKQVATPNLPTCIYWSYNEANLLPGQLHLPTFTSNPDSCLPLKYMFQLAGVENIPSALADAGSRPHGLRNLLNRVAELSTKHMHSVWQEYKGLSISLSPNGENVDAAIQDRHNLFDMSRRSDGFKRFITFLLLVSAKVKTDVLTNTLYLHDEPDTSLHPTGARHLRDELIRISEKNYVAYATHSIFMVDSDHLNRHLIVEKVDEVTAVREVTESNVVDEEVIYNALGYSIFQNLKRANIVFEGWRDKKLFMVATSRWPAEYKELKGVYAPVGKCHARGARDVARITPMLDLADRHYVVVSDSDRPAREQQESFRGEGRWLRYDELVDDATAVTAEDFIKAEAFLPGIEQVRTENPQLPPLTEEHLDDPRGRILVMSDWLAGNAVGKDQVKITLETIKETVFTNLKPAQVLRPYYEVLRALAQYLSPPAVAA